MFIDITLFLLIHHFLTFALILVEAIKDHNSPAGDSRTIGRVIKAKVLGISKVAGVVSNSGQVVGRDTVKVPTAKRDTINRDMAMVIGTAGIRSITTTSIGASNNRVVRRLQLAAKL